METAGKTLDEAELSDAMKETGLGTPATRAAIIEVLLKREYIVRNGKTLEATDKGIRLIEVVHPEVKSPAMTGQWEAYMARIQRGKRRCSRSWRDRRLRERSRRQCGRRGNAGTPRIGASAAEPLLRRRAHDRGRRHARTSAPSGIRLRLVPTESGSGVPSGGRRAKMCCWSCRRDRESRCATSCQESRAAERRW